jgi:hypothetical protein
VAPARARPRASGSRLAMCHVCVNTAGLQAPAAMGLSAKKAEGERISHSPSRQPPPPALRWLPATTVAPPVCWLRTPHLLAAPCSQQQHPSAVPTAAPIRCSLLPQHPSADPALLQHPHASPYPRHCLANRGSQVSGAFNGSDHGHGHADAEWAEPKGSVL